MDASGVCEASCTSRIVSRSSYLLLVVLLASIAGRVAAQDESCSTSRLADDIYNDVINSIAFDTESLKWTATPGPGAARVRLDSSAKMQEVLGPLLRNRRLLFLGDSTARNPAMVLMTMMCNDHFDQCYQWLGWNRKDSLESINCNSDVPGNDYTCASDVSVWEVPIPGITANATPTSRAARKAMWANGALPPLTRAISQRLNVSIDMLEAGCSTNDHIVSVLHKFIRSKHTFSMRVKPRLLSGNESNKISAAAAESGPESMAQYDGVVVAAGMHCTYESYRSGRWYRRLAQVFRHVAPRTPVIFLELPHCMKHNTRVSQRTLVDCAFAASASHDMKAVLTVMPGIFFAPTRSFTVNRSMMGDPVKRLTARDRQQSHCPFSDFLHPSVSCYVPIAASALHTLDRAIKGLEVKMPKRDACASRDALPELQILDHEVNRMIAALTMTTVEPDLTAPEGDDRHRITSAAPLPTRLPDGGNGTAPPQSMMNDSATSHFSGPLRLQSVRRNDVDKYAVFGFVLALIAMVWRRCALST